MTAKLHYMEKEDLPEHDSWSLAGWPVTDENKGGYGLAIEKLCELLGCDGPIWQQLEDGPIGKIQPYRNTGWVDVGDGEGDDMIYHNDKMLAHIRWSSRGFWLATATLTDGRTLYCKGANIEMHCEKWRSEQYSMAD